MTAVAGTGTVLPEFPAPGSGRPVGYRFAVRPSLEQVPQSPHLSWHLAVREQDGFAFDWHYHPEYELTLIVSGSGRRYVGDAVHDYGPDDLVLVGADTPHTWESAGTGEHRAVIVQFRRDTFGPGFFDLPEFRQVDRLLAGSAPGLHFAGGGAAAVRGLMSTMPDLDPPRRTLRLMDILVTLCGLAGEPLATGALVATLDPSARRRVERVIAYVNRCYPEELSIREAARLAAMTPNAFSRFFHRCTGRTFGDYVNDVRLAQACRRLIHDDSAISQIAAECGYANLSHFNRRFRASKGMSPRELRRHFRSR
jgi:AraC-like DNA-binding protein